MQRAICCRIFTPAARSEYPAASLRDYCCGALSGRSRPSSSLSRTTRLTTRMPRTRSRTSTWKNRSRMTRMMSRSTMTKRGARRHAGAAGQLARRLKHEIVRITVERGSRGARDGQRQGWPGGDLDLVGEVGEGNQRVEQVIAVGAAADDVQPEIDLGARERHACCPSISRPAWCRRPSRKRSACRSTC